MKATQIPDKVLSIRQPWAALILAGHKTVENRTWETLWTGRFLVHAGKKLADSFDSWEIAQQHGLETADLTTGAYLGSVRLVGVHRETGGCCQPLGDLGQYHWVVTEPITLPHPIPGPGRLGLYRTPLEIAAALEEQHV
jgi:hypothetical protein